ncbi:MAG: hypothetical protein IPM32_10915 [Ignavibacteriae bacterium]|nr:hypothetical protein [Ignavibacteriota bacterium]
MKSLLLVFLINLLVYGHDSLKTDTNYYQQDSITQKTEIQKVFITNEKTLIEKYEGFIGAFLGAFFAFLFFRIGEFLNRIVRRKNLHISALVKIDRNLNEIHDVIHGNTYIYDKIIEQNQEAEKLGVPSITNNNFQKLSFDELIIHDLINTDYFKEIFSLKVKIRKYNSDIETIFGLLKSLGDSYLSKMIDKDTYIFNHNNAINKLGELKKYNVFLQKLVKELIAKARTLVAIEKTITQKIYFSIVKKKYNKKFHKKYPTELNKISEDIEKGQEKDKSLLDEIFNK